jgi:hypothetical protein
MSDGNALIFSMAVAAPACQYINLKNTAFSVRNSSLFPSETPPIAAGVCVDQCSATTLAEGPRSLPHWVAASAAPVFQQP